VLEEKSTIEAHRRVAVLTDATYCMACGAEKTTVQRSIFLLLLVNIGKMRMFPPFCWVSLCSMSSVHTIPGDGGDMIFPSHVMNITNVL
jgi:hypothetical protein